jgi:arylsulfatase A-like enzyme
VDAPGRRPNILLIISDQLRRHALGCYGDPNVSTPHLDRLAAEGVRFANSCVTYPVCVPSRFTLMTGQYAHSRLVPAIGWRMSPAERTIAHELGDAGYQTAYVGKWHLFGAHPGRGRPLAHKRGLTPIPRPFRGGFECWRAFEFRNDPFDTHYFVDDDPAPHRIDGYQTDGLFGLAQRFLAEERDRDRPFFLVLSVEPPHSPLVAPESYLARWRDRELVLAPNVPSAPARSAQADRPAAAKRRDDLRRYYAMVENLDDNVGALLRFLDSQGLRDDTAIVFLADHGDLKGGHGLDGKQHPYEESVGVPFIVSHPRGGAGGGRVLPDVTCTEDWFPTLRGLAGLPPRPGTPGVDLSARLRGGPGLARDGVLLELVMDVRPSSPYYEQTWRAWRTERFKYTLLGGEAGARPWHLFDLREDPYELRNLVDDPRYQEVAAQLHGRLLRAVAESHDDYTVAPAFGHPGYRLWTTDPPPAR